MTRKIRSFRDWLFGPPETPAEAQVRTGSPSMGPCSHAYNGIAPDVADPDQRHICTGCGGRFDATRVYGRENREAERLREANREEARRLREEAFRELRDRVDSLPELEVRLGADEVAFPAIYQPIGPTEDFKRYGVTLPAARLLEAFEDQSNEAVRATLEDLMLRYLAAKVRPARPDGRYGTGGVPFDYIRAQSRIRPEVYTIRHGGPRHNHHEDLDSLATQLDRLAVRNLSPDRLFRDRAMVVHLKLFAYHKGTSPSSQWGVGLALTKVGVGVEVAR